MGSMVRRSISELKARTPTFRKIVGHQEKENKSDGDAGKRLSIIADSSPTESREQDVGEYQGQQTTGEKTLDPLVEGVVIDPLLPIENGDQRHGYEKAEDKKKGISCTKKCLNLRGAVLSGLRVSAEG